MPGGSDLEAVSELGEGLSQATIVGVPVKDMCETVKPTANVLCKESMTR